MSTYFQTDAFKLKLARAKAKEVAAEQLKREMCPHNDHKLYRGASVLCYCSKPTGWKNIVVFRPICFDKPKDFKECQRLILDTNKAIRKEKEREKNTLRPVR